MMRMRPDLAEAGTEVTKPSPLRTRSFDVSATRLPPDAECARRLQTTSMWCLVRLRPLKRSRPPGATVCGSLVHTTTGQQRTDEMCGARERALAAGALSR